jgi:hypothetical protein
MEQGAHSFGAVCPVCPLNLKSRPSFSRENVAITIFCDFRQFLFTKLAFKTEYKFSNKNWLIFWKLCYENGKNAPKICFSQKHSFFFLLSVVSRDRSSARTRSRTRDRDRNRDSSRDSTPDDDEDVSQVTGCFKSGRAGLATRVARFIFKPKIPIWVNFGGHWNGKC